MDSLFESARAILVFVVIKAVCRDVVWGITESSSGSNCSHSREAGVCRSGSHQARGSRSRQPQHSESKFKASWSANHDRSITTMPPATPKNSKELPKLSEQGYPHCAFI